MSNYSVNHTILFVYNALSSFVKTDRNLLQQKWRIQDWYQCNRWINLATLWQAILYCDLIFCWFAGWHSFAPVILARLLGKPAVVVTGGYDVANLPQAGYGSQRGGLRRLMARSVLKNSTHLVAFSHHAKNEAITNATIKPEKITVIPLGLPALPAGPLTIRDNLAITVGGVWRENFLRKGLLPFVQAAAYLPETKFMLIGKWYDDSIKDLRRIAGANVELTGFVSDEQLINLYQRASIYVQPSLHEGFGLSVAEAMMAGCIPVVTRCGSLPEVVGKAGIYLNSTKPEEIAAAIQQGQRLSGPQRRQARNRIIHQFPLEQRQYQLQALIHQFLS